MELVLDSATVARLAADPAVTAEFPFLAAYRPRAARGCCGGRSAPAAPDASRAAAALLSLPDDRKAAFKRVTGATRVVGLVVRAARVVRAEF